VRHLSRHRFPVSIAVEVIFEAAADIEAVAVGVEEAVDGKAKESDESEPWKFIVLRISP